ncbi:ATP-binding cassette domain-containing protein [Desulfosarcina ovata]|uniref:ABC transporter ATP-binding protein n=1 Tax=Desulfosarcina ovata subsp. ovata TaxID=2752305 RepID=A0A5K8AL13_9BACT|nr:ATP-binding cassette domain-containing protein [Desulfosarcina ovata]BBO93395.1 ABC transporter ATP-binding protein [Desulfosarcina ovata subsp. ovata]
MLQKITVMGGVDKNGHPEPIRRLDIHPGEVLAVVGPTGAGKTQLIADIEQYREGEAPTGRQVLIDGHPYAHDPLNPGPRHLVAEVSQKMNFIIDTTVEAFLARHARVRAIASPETVINTVLTVANQLAGEPLSPTDNLTRLSGGQARALMVGDVALISNAPVVLVDEIENAGIDRLSAMAILSAHGKMVLVVTHDPTLMLMAGRRVIMKNGGMHQLHRTTPAEIAIMETLAAREKDISRLRDTLRSGQQITDNVPNKETQETWQAFYCTARSTSAGRSAR